MSSKKFVYLLIAVALACGFIMGDTAHGQSTGSLTFSGSVLDADENPVPGYTISAEFVPARTGFQIIPVSRADGSYSLAILGFAIGGPTPKINVGETIKITATGADGNAVSATHTVTAEDVATSSVKDFNIVLSGLTVQANPASIPAHDSNTSTITVTVRQGGAGITGDTISLSVPAGKGTVDATATEVGDGDYTAIYTAPSIALVGPESVEISVSSAATELKKSVSILLTPVPTTVSLEPGKNSFMAEDAPEETTVTVKVNRIDPVTDEIVTLTLTPASGFGSVSDVTNNEDGTYSATYTSGSTAGNVTLTATATTALATGSATITINAGPPANVVVTADPTIVTSLGSATITAMVTDSNGNPAGGTVTAETTSGGTVGDFTSTVFGTYTAAYAAPELDVEETETIIETITVSADDASGSVEIELLPEDPIDVTILTIEGTVYKEDGEITADEGTEVTVTVGGNSQTTTTDANGYMVLFISDLISPVATTGDMVSLAVADANVVRLNVNGTERAGSSFRLINDILEKVAAGDSVMVDVTTDTVIPPRFVSSLVVEGMVYREDGVTAAGSGLDVTVTVGERTQTVQTEVGGSYMALFIVDLITNIATTGDEISVKVSDSSGDRTDPPPPTPEQATLSNKELGTTGSATVIRNVKTNIRLTANILAVSGTVNLKNGDTDSVPAAKDLRETELTVVVKNTDRNISVTGSVDDEGEYEVLFVGENLADVAETDNEIVVEVQNDAGVVVGSESHILTVDDINATRAPIDVDTNVPARVLALHVEGDVIQLDGSSAGPGVEVTLTIMVNGTPDEAQVVTDITGRYRHLFAAVSPESPAARTDDMLEVQVLRVADGYIGYRIMELRSHEIAYENQPLIVMPPIKLLPPTLRLGGLSINTSHADAYYGYLSLEAIKKNPELLQLIPSGILHVDLSQNLLASLPSGFNPTPEPSTDPTKMFDIDSENFGNGITPRPAWHVLAGSSPADSGRWLNGNQLNLYVVTGPVPSVQSVTFTLTGPHSDEIKPDPVPAGGYMHNFQLEEERAILFLPSWPDLNMDAPIFSGVTLMLDDGGEIPMTSKLVGDEVVWEAPATLTAGSRVYYHYQVTLAQPYQLDDGTEVSSWPMPDPRNLQVENRGIVETLLAPDVPELKEIVTTTDLKLRSVFDVPAPGANESLWVATFDFPAGADGEYSVDTTVQYEGGLVRSIPNQMFTLDRTPPTAGITAAIGASAGLYERDDGSLVTAAHTDEGTLTLTTMPMAASSESAAYLYQVIQLDAEGNPGSHVWNPITVTGEMLPLTYMEPHQVQIPIGDSGHYGIRAVGVDSILNIGSNTMPRMLDIVSPDPDVATLTLVHADYNGDGTTDGPFEMEQSADGVTIFSDRSTVNLTFAMAATNHPLKSIAVDFQINGEGDWKSIPVAADLVAAKDGFHVSWDRTEDFAGLLDMRGQATVRVTVINALDISAERTATFEIVPPALQLGGLSINTGYENGLNTLQALAGLDVTALATSLLGVDPFSLVTPSPLPLALALLGMVSQIQGELPEGFETGDEQIHRENFGNALTPKPIWHAIAPPDQQDSGRWVNGNQLHLYTVAGPTAESVMFSIGGAGTATAAAEKVEAGGTFKYNFQLEEELVAIFAGSMPAFAGVTLMIDGQAPIPMVGNAGVWSAEADLTPGYPVSYYYRITLAEPYQDMFLDRPIQVFPIPDPRSLQMADGNVMQSIMVLLEGGTDVLGVLDPGLRSTFTVPAVDDDSQSLWVGKLGFPADGMYQLDVAVAYSSGSTDALTGKMFTVDRMAPTADTTVHLDHPGENIGMYLRDADGTYVATALPNPGAAKLNVSAVPIDDSDLEAYLYQFARLDDATGTPGTWNPMLTMDLQVLDLTSGLPLTTGHHVQMLVRSATGSDLDYGTYGLRVVGIDNILNADSSRGPGVVLNLVPPDPDSAMVSLVHADYDGNGTMDGPYEMQAADGATIFSDSMVTLSVEITERTDHPLMIEVEYQVAGGDWHSIGTLTDAATSAMVGDQLPVNWHVGDYAELPNTTGHVMVRTIATNGLTISRTSEVSLAYERRLAPAIAAIHVDAADLHPTSNAPRGGITISAFTQAMTNPETTAIQFEIRRAADADSDWQPIGVAQLLGNTTVVSNVQTPLIEDLIGTIVAGASSAPLSSFYRQWSIPVDTTTLEDTILDGTPAETDVSQDDNPYVVQATAVDVASMGYPSADGVGADFSVDNYSPTEITQVDNEVETVEPDENGNYYVSGLIAEDVPAPMRKLTAWTGAYPGVFPGGIKLVVNDADSGAAVEIPETIFGAAGNYTYIGDFQLASVENGVYTFKAVAYTADGMAEERIVARPITVEVRNFNPLTDILSVIVIDTEGEARTPSEIDTMYPIGFPAVEDQFTFTLTTNHVRANEIDVMIGDDGDSARMLGALTDDGIMVTANADGSTSFEITLDTSMLADGRFNLTGTITKPNGSAPFDLPGIRVDRTAPVVEIVSPIAREQLTALPTIQVTYTDASGFDPNDMAMEEMPVVITLTRLPSGEVIDIVEGLIHITAAADGEIQTQMGNIVYTHGDALPGGAYRIDATVTDILGNVGSAEPVEITVEGLKPTVSVMSPLSGQIVDPRQPLIVSVALTGSGELTVTEFQINGTDIEGTLEDNWLTYTMQPPLVGADDSILQRGSDNTVSVKIVDSEGYTAENGISFAVSLDNTPPVISGPAPQGEITRKIGRVTARVSDNESNITRIQYALDDAPLTDISFSPGMVVEVGRGKEVKGQTSFNLFDAPLGTHSVTIIAESTGGTSTLTWEFTIVHPDTKPPEVVTYSPLGIIRTDRPILAATVSDESGFKRDGITLILAGVPGNQGSGRRSSPTSTTVTFTPSISVTPGPYTARLTVIDKYNNRTEAEWQFTVELDSTPPAITTTSPHGVVQVDKPIISVSASDDMSGVDTIDISVKNESSQAVAGVTSVRSDRTSATFTPTTALTSGTYTVDVKLADMSGNKASGQWQFTVELDTVAPIVFDTRPSQEHTENRRPVISASYTDTVSGVDVGSVKLTLDGSLVEPDTLSDTQVTFTPTVDLPFGPHTVKLEVSDMAPSANTAVHEWTFYVERVGIADARNYPNPFDHETTIAFRLSRQASITIRIYDFTGRLVAQPVANSRYEAGEVKIDWHNETAADDHLARGVYFCHILMEDHNFESQSAILKMAIISE